MKKILLLIIPFIISGCYDYVELTDLSIITTITIDKNNNQYNISLEILNSQNKNEKSLIVSGSGHTISGAINNTFKNTPKQPYLAHLKVLIVSKEVAKNDLRDIMEYLLRSPKIRSEFYLLIYDGNKSKDVFNIQSNEIPVISDYLERTINQNSNSSNNINIKNFEKILIEIFEQGKDTTIPTITINNNTIMMEGNALMSDYNLIDIIDYPNSLSLNILDGSINNATYSLKCPDNNNEISLTIYEAKSNYKVKNNQLSIKSNLMAEIDEYSCQMNLKDPGSIEKLNAYYSLVFNNMLKDFYELIRTNKTDTLGIGKLLYNQRRYYEKNSWLYLKYTINTNLKINKQGLIFEVQNGN